MTTPDRAILAQRLLALLEAELGQVSAFAEILEQERTVLSQRDVEPLFALAERKAVQARTLHQFADQRSALLAQAGLKNDRAGIEQLIGNAQHPAWLKYQTAAAQARDLNKQNGILITERMSGNHQALALLMSLSDAPTTYGPDGQATTRPGSRLFGSV